LSTKALWFCSLRPPILRMSVLDTEMGGKVVRDDLGLGRVELRAVPDHRSNHRGPLLPVPVTFEGGDAGEVVAGHAARLHEGLPFAVGQLDPRGACGLGAR